MAHAALSPARFPDATIAMDPRLELYRRLARPADTRILYMVVDGLGGLPGDERGRTELEAARTPTFDRLAREGDCGLITPVLPGVTPGSGPAHIALFGYDPLECQVGRGILSALGVGFDLAPGDVAARINFCTLDADGNVTDRRAGRIGDEIGAPLAERLDALDLEGPVEMHVRSVKQYRACLVLRGNGLDGRIADTDPQRTGVPPLEARALAQEAEPTARLAREFVRRAHAALADQDRANGVLLRGFDDYRPLLSFEELYGLEAIAVAAYPMYRGVARLAGMEAVASADDPDELARHVRATEGRDFVFLHYKASDSRGEDGDFDAKVAEIEKADALLEAVRDDFDVVMVTGDHSTPSTMRAHSWHPVPVLVHGGPARGHDADAFGERACLRGSLGTIRSYELLPFTLAHAGRLAKFGA